MAQAKDALRDKFIRSGLRDRVAKVKASRLPRLPKGATDNRDNRDNCDNRGND